MTRRRRPWDWPSTSSSTPWGWGWTKRKQLLAIQVQVLVGRGRESQAPWAGGWGEPCTPGGSSSWSGDWWGGSGPGTARTRTSLGPCQGWCSLSGWWLAWSRHLPPLAIHCRDILQLPHELIHLLLPEHGHCVVLQDVEPLHQGLELQTQLKNAHLEERTLKNNYWNHHAHQLTWSGLDPGLIQQHKGAGPCLASGCEKAQYSAEMEKKYL